MSTLNFSRINQIRGLHYHKLTLNSDFDATPLFSFHLKPVSPHPNKQIGLLFFPDLFGSTLLYEDFYLSFFNEFKNTTFLSGFDYLGHGFSYGPRMYVPSMNTWIKDGIQFINKSLEFEKTQKVFLMGVGFGASLLMKIMMEFESQIKRQIDGLILISPLIEPKFYSYQSFFNLPLYSQMMTYSKNWQIRLPHLIGIDKITDDYYHQRFILDHPRWLSFYTPSTYIALKELLKDFYSLSYFCDYKTQIIFSKLDEISKSSQIKLFSKGLNHQMKEEHAVDGHAHDLLLSKNRKEVFNKIFTYLKK